MSSRNTALFGASLLVAVAVVAVDHAVSEAPQAISGEEESYNPCAAAAPVEPGQRSYDDIADDYSGVVAPAPAPAPQDSANPCSAGVP